MKNIFGYFLDKTKTQPDIWLFFLFLFTFSFGVRKVLFYFPIERTFNEYTASFAYFSDLFLFLAIGSWLLFLLLNNLTILSNALGDKRLNGRILALIKQNTAIDKLWITQLIHSLYWILPLFLVVWTFISISWAQNKGVALFRSIKLLELYLLYLYLVYRFIPYCIDGISNSSENLRNSNRQRQGRWNILAKAGGIIIFIALFQSIVAILQFILQNSLGLRFLRESIINPDMPGVAKIILDGEKYIRAYGLMPHPNVLGGFLVFSLMITWLYSKLFENVPRGTFLHSIYQKCSTWNIFNLSLEMGAKDKTTSENPHIFPKIWLTAEKGLIRGIILVQILALLLTFSKSAILAFMICFLYIFYKTMQSIVLGSRKLNCSTPACRTGWCGTILLVKKKLRCLKFRFRVNMKDYPKLFHVEQFRIIILSLLIILISLFLFFKPDLNSLFLKSLDERFVYQNVSRGTILSSPIMGVGMGQFVLSMSHFSENVLMSWQYQPVHNVYSLIWAEIGIVGLGVFLGWLVVIFWRISYRYRELFHACLPDRQVEQCKVNYRLCCELDSNSDNAPPAYRTGRRGTLSASSASGKGEKEDRFMRDGFKIASNNYFACFVGRRAWNNNTKVVESGYSILNNNNIILSIEVMLVCFKGILLGFLFIMLFDHYFWDIWQGQVLFWMVVAMIIGIERIFLKMHRFKN